MPKKKQHHKSTEELVAEGLRAREVERKRDIIVNKFYPALVAATISVDEAKALIQAMGTCLMEQVLKTMKERQFSEIAPQLLSILCSDGERKDEVTTVLESLSTENLFTAREIIEGMTGAIERMILTDMQNRTLSTLSPNWELFLNK